MWINREKSRKKGIFTVEKPVDIVDRLVDYSQILWKGHFGKEEGKHAEQFNSRTKK